MAKLLAASAKRSLRDDDGKPFDSIIWPITGLEAFPPDWHGTGKLTLDLSKPEQTFLARKLRAVRSPIDGTQPSLLSRLVGKPLDGSDHCWDEMILSLAGKDEPALRRAGQAAALSAVGRAVYAAQVETLKEERDRRPQQNLHRAALKETVSHWGNEAAGLNMALFLDDVGKLPTPVETVIKETWSWLRSGSKNPMKLLEFYARAETVRKGDRARLANNQFGVDRRVEWQGENHGRAESLHYRWGNVKRLLRDLEGVA